MFRLAALPSLVERAPHAVAGQPLIFCSKVLAQRRCRPLADLEPRRQVLGSEHPELALLVVLAPRELASLQALASAPPELALLVASARLA